MTEYYSECCLVKNMLYPNSDVSYKELSTCPLCGEKTEFITEEELEDDYE